MAHWTIWPSLLAYQLNIWQNNKYMMRIAMLMLMMMMMMMMVMEGMMMMMSVVLSVWWIQLSVVICATGKPIISVNQLPSERAPMKQNTLIVFNIWQTDSCCCPVVPENDQKLVTSESELEVWMWETVCVVTKSIRSIRKCYKQHANQIRHW